MILKQTVVWRSRLMSNEISLPPVSWTAALSPNTHICVKADENRWAPASLLAIEIERTFTSLFLSRGILMSDNTPAPPDGYWLKASHLLVPVLELECWLSKVTSKSEWYAEFPPFAVTTRIDGRFRRPQQNWLINLYIQSFSYVIYNVHAVQILYAFA